MPKAASTKVSKKASPVKTTTAKPAKAAPAAPAPKKTKAAAAAPAKKIKKKKDPNAPKRPMSAFMYFSNDKRAGVVAEQPDLKFGEVGKAIGALWKETSAAERAPYEAMAKNDKERYTKAFAKYQANKPADDEDDDEEEEDDDE
ncbi:Non-histone chromosomal protein 6 [Blyttiomyces sp. JEL0837]|nr:Non-histone chromosomal protein 6 [Blyttiomyces sp. JEL0837]